MSSLAEHDNSTSRIDMPAEFLVSVRSASEALDAIKIGVDILDWKEPNDGPLAPTNVQLWQTAVSMVDLPSCDVPEPSTRLSVALGESETAARLAGSVPSAIRFAKAGPKDCDHWSKLERLWSDVRNGLSEPTILVAVAYADHLAANCLSASDVFRAASRFGIRHCLLDTFYKDGRSTIDHLGFDGLQKIQAVVNEERLWWSLAGSIRSGDVSRLARNTIRPHCFGVRGDVCERDRTSRLSQERLLAWKKAIAATQPTPIRSSSSDALQNCR